MGDPTFTVKLAFLWLLLISQGASCSGSDRNFRAEQTGIQELQEAVAFPSQIKDELERKAGRTVGLFVGPQMETEGLLIPIALKIKRSSCASF